MKFVFFSLMSVVFLACQSDEERVEAVDIRIDSLEYKLKNTYKPGFGDFMSTIQVHHSKLWFAGQNKNWKLADFEIHELIEAIENIKKYQTERKESQNVGMINAALDSVKNTIQQKDHKLFNAAYVLLTNSCNECHRANNFEFNVVKIPDAQIFSNQDFKVEVSK